MDIHRELKIPKCPYCVFIPENMEDAMNHLNNNHKTKSLKDLIEIELKKFIKYDKENLKTDLRIPNHTWYECPLCNYKDKNRELIIKHLDENNHEDKDLNSQNLYQKTETDFFNKDLTKISYKCPFDGFLSKKPLTLNFRKFT